MHLPKFRSAFLAGALLGVVAPILSLASHRFAEHVAGGRGAFLWLSGIFLLATDGHEHEPGAYATIAMSIGANMLLYAVVVSLLWCVGWVLRAWRASLRDGTTI